MPAETPGRHEHLSSWLDEGRYRLLGIGVRPSRESGPASGLPSAIAGNPDPPLVHGADLSNRLVERDKALIMRSVSSHHECVRPPTNPAHSRDDGTVRHGPPGNNAVLNLRSNRPKAVASDRLLIPRHPAPSVHARQYSRVHADGQSGSPEGRCRSGWDPSGGSCRASW